jgi:hypothetical protein
MDRLSAEAQHTRWFRWKASLVSSRLVQAAILVVAFLCFTIPFYIHSLNKADALEPSWSSAAIWVQSADCARRTGAVLVICKDGGLVPNVSAGDDLGQALALGVYSILTQKTVTQNDVSRLNSTLNYIGIALLAACLFSSGLPLVAFLVLTGGAIIANQFHSLGPHPAHLGLACLAAILPLSIVALSSRRTPVRLIWIATGLLGLGIAMIFREPIGLMGVVASLLAVGVNCVRPAARSPKAFVAMGLLACAILMTVAIPQTILRVRDIVYHVPPSALVEQHGIWHSLYIGLGAVSNPFGIAWDDTNGLQAARNIDPSITYLSAEYFAVLRHEYFRIVMSHPFEVARIYLEKLAIAADTYETWKIMLAVVVIAAIMRRRRRIVGEWHSAEFLLFFSACFVAMFLGQAMLFHYSPQYLFPVKLFLLLSIGGLIELLLSTSGPPSVRPN